jgi:FAD/FMN-containing dehydrogenase
LCWQTARGYDIKSLFIGAEGTLGVITAASLKLYPLVRVRATAFAAVASPAAAVALLDMLRVTSGDRVSSFELIPRIGIELTTRHIAGITDPLSGPARWYVLTELGSSCTQEPLDSVLAATLTDAHARKLVSDAVLAKNERERGALWRLRESIPEAQRKDGASLKHDISVPIARVPEFIQRAGDWVDRNVPQGLLVAYGHLGDGNLHFNVNQRAGTDAAGLLAQADAVQRVIHDLVRDFGGSFSAEHGIGQLKVAELERYADPTELALMRTVKAALDPRGIMNPGKVLDARVERHDRQTK